MKKYFLILLLTIFLGTFNVASATSGACSDHGGVSCGIENYDGHAICKDSFISSTYYSDTEECKDLIVKCDLPVEPPCDVNTPYDCQTKLILFQVDMTAYNLCLESQAKESKVIVVPAPPTPPVIDFCPVNSHVVGDPTSQMIIDHKGKCQCDNGFQMNPNPKTLPETCIKIATTTNTLTSQQKENACEIIDPNYFYNSTTDRCSKFIPKQSYTQDEMNAMILSGRAKPTETDNSKLPSTGSTSVYDRLMNKKVSETQKPIDKINWDALNKQAKDSVKKTAESSTTSSSTAQINTTSTSTTSHDSFVGKIFQSIKNWIGGFFNK